VEHEGVPGVAEHALPYEGESLAGCAADYQVDRPPSDAGARPDLGSCESLDVATDNGRIGNVVSVGGGVNRVDLNRRQDVEARLLNPKRQAAGAGEKVDTGGPMRLAFGIGRNCNIS
jgi:hypothetical protein